MSTVETSPLPALNDELLSDAEIEVWNEAFPEISPADRIDVVSRRLGGRVIAASSFGPTAPVLLKAVSEVEPDIPVVHVRHHHETLKTLGLTNWYTEEFGLDVQTKDAPPLLKPPFGSSEFVEFQQQVKVEPFREALEEHQPLAYFSGRMRWQSRVRRELPFVERKGSLIVVNAVVDVSYEEVEDIFDVTGWPRDPNYSDPTKGPDQKSECGLNTTDYVLVEAGEGR